jgi:HlyD family secretion protein
MRRVAFVIVPLGIGLLALMPVIGREAPGADAYTWTLERVDRGAIVSSVSAAGAFRTGPDGTVEVVATVPDAQVWRVRPGQTVQVVAVLSPRRELTGRVREVLLGPSALDNVTVAFSMPEGSVAVPAGTAADVRIICERRDNVLRVPTAALHWQAPGATADPQPVSRDGQPTTGPKRWAAELADMLRRELKLEDGQMAAAEAAIAEARRAAFAGAEADADPSLRRERFKVMRRDIRERLTALLPAEQKVRLHEVIAAWSDASRRGEPVAGRFYIVGDDGRPVPVAARVGPSDGTRTEIVGAPVEPGTAIITGSQPRPRGLLRLGF